jgi:hypothetical protein
VLVVKQYSAVDRLLLLAGAAFLVWIAVSGLPTGGAWFKPVLTSYFLKSPRTYARSIPIMYPFPAPVRPCCERRSRTDSGGRQVTR